MASLYPYDTHNQTATPANRLRRQWLKGAVGTLAGAALVYFGWTRYLFPPETPPTQGRGPAATGLRLGPVTEFAVGSAPRVVTVPIPGTDKIHPYVVENVGPEFRVLSAVCTHMGCTVAWSPRNAQLICPCHGARYSTDGTVLAGPAQKPLPPVPHHVQDGVLYVLA